MKKFLCIALITLSALSLVCCKKAFKTTRTENDTVSAVADDDAAMNAIIAEARATVGSFLAELKAPAADESFFSVKYPFKTDEGSETKVEHIWLGDIAEENGKFFGIVGNDPFYIKGMKNGDRVEFDIASISDWMYYKGARIVGGKSMKYILENTKNLTEDEKKFLDSFD